MARRCSTLAYPYGLHDEVERLVQRGAPEAGYRMRRSRRAPSPTRSLYAAPRRLIRGQESRTAFRIKIDEEHGDLFG